MKANIKIELLLVVMLVLSFGLATIASAQIDGVDLGLKRGFRVGYSDGFLAGSRDIAKNLTRNYSRHVEYKKANRKFDSDYGTLENYQDGYQQGFESGYDLGYDGLSIEVSPPDNLKYRGVVLIDLPSETDPPPDEADQTIVTSSADINVALQRGFRTGYSDGYMAGYRDKIDGQEKVYGRHVEYESADRAYSRDFGLLEDYRDGYQQGFRSGYDGGFAKLTFEAAIPTDLTKRGTIGSPTLSQRSPETVAENRSQEGSTVNGVPNIDRSVIIIPSETELILELQENISTLRIRADEVFAARVIMPAEIAGAMVEGRVKKAVASNGINRYSEITLSFDRIILNNNRSSSISALLTEVLPVKGDNVRLVNAQGSIIGTTRGISTKKIGITACAGAVFGAITGGPVGAIFGATAGFATGIGVGLVLPRKHIRLSRTQQLRIKTTAETQIF